MLHEHEKANIVCKDGLTNPTICRVVCDAVGVLRS